MEFLRFIASIPGRLLAMLLGVTVLPIRAVLGFIERAILITLLSLAAIIGVPIFLAYLFNSTGMPKIANVLITVFIVAPISTFLILGATAFVAGSLVVSTLFTIAKSIWTGLTSGLLKGFDGFLEAFRAQPAAATNLIMSLGAFLNRNAAAADDQIGAVEFDGFQQIVGELVDVVVQPREHDVPDLMGETQKVGELVLTAPEINTVDEFLSKIPTINKPLAPAVKLEVELLKTRVAQYKSLSTRLEKAKELLTSGEKSKIDEELMNLEVETPIYFAKQYQDESGKWLNVPAAGYITDKASLLQWLKTKPTHPFNRESIKNPPNYKDKPTRYQWHELTKDNCYSQELGECADEIRGLIKKITPKLDAIELQSPRPGSSRDSMFSQSAETNRSEESKDPIMGIM